MLSDGQRSLIAARLRKSSAEAKPRDAANAASPGRSTPVIELTRSGDDGGRVGRLFLVHAIGGTVHPYVPLATLLSPDLTVYGIEAAGLAPGSVPAASLETMTESYLAAIRAAQPEGGPCRLAGWSMGGIVAYELARRFEQEGEKVAALILLDPPFGMPRDSLARAGSPDAQDAANQGDRDGAGYAGYADRRIAAWFIADATQTLAGAETVGSAPDPAKAGVAEQLDWLAHRFDVGAGQDESSSRGSSNAVRAELGRRFEVFRAHARLIAGYEPTAALHTRTLLLSSRFSPNVAFVERWRALLGQDAVTIQHVDADHYTFLQPPLVSHVAAGLRAWLREQ